MNKSITFVKRKPSPEYKSIEGLFGSVISNISSEFEVDEYFVSSKGASPLVLLQNICGFFNIKKRHIVHVTGDVHYMVLSTRKKTILTIHDIGSALKGNILKQFYIKLFWFWLPALSVKYITVISEFTKEELQKVIPFAKHKIKVIPNPVSPLINPTPLNFKREKPIILCIGTKDNKNLLKSIEALDNLPCKLTIIGELKPEHLNQLERYNIDYENYFDLSFKEVSKWYERCDILCFPSTYEGFGMPIIEAQATGRPVLTSNFGAMKEVAKNSACLVNPYDVRSIRNGLMKIIEDKDYRCQLIDKGLENVKQYNIDEVAKQYRELYKKLL